MALVSEPLSRKKIVIGKHLGRFDPEFLKFIKV